MLRCTEAKRGLESLSHRHPKLREYFVMNNVIATATLFISLCSFSIFAQSFESFATFNGSSLKLAALKIGDKVYQDVVFYHEGNLKFAYRSFSGELISNKKTNSSFDGSKIVVKLLKFGSSIYSNLLLVPNSEGSFTALSADVPLLDDKLSAKNRDTDSWIAYKSIRNQGIKQANKDKYNQCDCAYNAIAYLDIDQDGDDDIFVSTIWYEQPYLQKDVKRIPAEIYLNNGDGTYTYDMSMIDGEIPTFVHSRKAIVSDFNGDLRPDIFVVDHGYDATPFPGESPWLLLSNPDGTYSTEYLKQFVGFHHSASAGDLDQDGDVDLFITGFDLLILLNDGNGNFTDSTTQFSSQLSDIGRLNTSEIYDINLDGKLDIIAACECLGNKGAKIWLGPDYKQVIDIRGVEPFTTIVDILPTNIDSDPDIEILLSITGSGPNNYQGAMVEMVTYTLSDESLSYETLYEEAPADSNLWIPWLKLTDNDNDGDLDILADSKSQGLVLEQYVDGAFRLISKNKKNW